MSDSEHGPVHFPALLFHPLIRHQLFDIRNFQRIIGLRLQYAYRNMEHSLQVKRFVLAHIEINILKRSSQSIQDSIRETLPILWRNVIIPENPGHDGFLDIPGHLPGPHNVLAHFQHGLMLADIVEFEISQKINPLHDLQVFNVQFIDKAIGEVQTPRQKQVLKRILLGKIIPNECFLNARGIGNILHRGLVEPFLPKQAESRSGNGFLFNFIFFSSQLQPLLFGCLFNAPIIPYFSLIFCAIDSLLIPFYTELELFLYAYKICVEMERKFK